MFCSLCSFLCISLNIHLLSFDFLSKYWVGFWYTKLCFIGHLKNSNTFVQYSFFCSDTCCLGGRIAVRTLIKKIHTTSQLIISDNATYYGFNCSVHRLINVPLLYLFISFPLLNPSNVYQPSCVEAMIDVFWIFSTLFFSPLLSYHNPFTMGITTVLWCFQTIYVIPL